MYRNIVVPLDGSDFSRAAIPYAVTLAAASDAAIELVSAVDSVGMLSGGTIATGAPAYGSGIEIPTAGPALVEAARRQREDALTDAAEAVRGASGATVRWELLDGEPSEAVAAHVERSGADLVVMSTHGRGGLERAWLGSIADRLIRRIAVPLLLVRPGEEGRQSRPAVIRRLLVPLDGSKLAEAVLDPAARIARQVDGSIELLRAVDPAIAESPYIPATVDDAQPYYERRRIEAGDYLTSVAERLRADGVDVTEVGIRDGSPSSIILARAREGADMVAMATHGRSGLERWLLGSVSDKVVRGADMPVLLVRPSHEAQ